MSRVVFVLLFGGYCSLNPEVGRWYGVLFFNQNSVSKNLILNQIKPKPKQH